MRLYLQTLPDGAAPQRYYQLALEQDLLGGWTLVREWGTPGAKPGGRREVYLERDDALAAFEAARDAQIRRGFRVMFAQGA